MFGLFRRIGSGLESYSREFDAIHFAAQHPALLSLLSRHYPLAPTGCYTHPVIHIAHSSPVVINLLVRAGHDPNAKDISGNSLPAVGF